MEREIHHIDEYFAEGLENIELIPPKDVWDNIEKELDRKRRVRFITICASMAAGLALLISIGISVVYNLNNLTKQVTITSKSDSRNQNNAAIISENNSLTSKHSAIAKSSSKAQPVIIAENFSNASSGQRLVIKSHDDNHVIMKNENIADSSSDQTVAMPIIVTNNTSTATEVRSTEQLSYIMPKTVRLENILSLTTIVQQNNKIETASSLKDVDPLLQFGALDKQEIIRTKHWSIEGQVAPQYSYRNISDIKGSAPRKKIYNENEDGLVAYVGGVKVNYESGKRLSFQTGVYYSVMGQAMNKVYEVKGQSIMSLNATIPQRTAYWVDNSLGPINTQESKPPRDQNTSLNSSDVCYSSIYFNSASSVLKAVNDSYNDGTLIDNAQIIQLLKFIEIPLLARYRIIDRKIGCHLIGGISTNLLVNSDVWLKQNGSRKNIGETSNLRYINYSSTIGLGVSYQWLKKISLSIEPTYKYYLNSITTNENMKVHPYSFGIYTGLVYKF